MGERRWVLRELAAMGASQAMSHEGDAAERRGSHAGASTSAPDQAGWPGEAGHQQSAWEGQSQVAVGVEGRGLLGVLGFRCAAHNPCIRLRLQLHTPMAASICYPHHVCTS